MNGWLRASLVLTLVAAITVGGYARVSADDVEERIAEFWRRIDARQATDYVTTAELGEWALNVIARDPRARLTVADFRVATAAMQAAIDRAGPGVAVTPAPTPTPAPSALIVQVGEFVTYADGWRVAVLRTEPQAPTQYSTLTPGFEYIALVVRYENGTTSQMHFNPHDWKVQDSTGVRRGPAFVVGSGRTDYLSFGDIAPGGFVQGSIIYEVPLGDVGLSVLYENFRYKLATWRLY